MKIFVLTKIWAIFWPFLVQKLAIFAQNQVFEHFLQNCAPDLSKTWPETGDSCFESFIGSVLSGKILDSASLSISGSKIQCLWWRYAVFGCFAIFLQTIYAVFWVRCCWFFCPNFDFGHRQDTITLRWGFQAGWIFKAFRRPKKPTLIPPPVPESDPTPREGDFRWGRVTFRQRGIFRREMFSGRGNSGLWVNI